MRKFNKTIFFISTAVFTLLLIPSFLAAWAEDEGTLGTNIIGVTFYKLFYILRFPTHTLLWTLVEEGGVLAFFGGLIINCMFYGLLTERLYHFLKEKMT